MTVDGPTLARMAAVRAGDRFTHDGRRCKAVADARTWHDGRVTIRATFAESASAVGWRCSDVAFAAAPTHNL